MQMNQIVVKNISVYVHTHVYTFMHVITMEKETMNLKVSKEEYMAGFEEEKMEGRNDIMKIIISLA